MKHKTIKEFLAEDCAWIRETLLSYARGMEPGIAALEGNKSPSHEQLSSINIARRLLGHKPIRR